MRSVEVHVEELVLQGFAPSDRYHIGEAMERELARLFAKQPAPPLLAQGSEVILLDGGTFEVAPGAKPEAIGTQVAQAVYGGLSR